MGESMKVAVVTGANRGIGLEVCPQLSERGFHVILTARNTEAGQAVATKLGLEFRPLDVADEASIATFVEKVKERHGQIDVLVNNAGVSLDGFGYRVVNETLAVNFYGPLRLTDAMLPILKDNARVVMVSSGMGELACLGVDLAERFSSDTLDRDQLLALMKKFVDDVAFEVHVTQGWPTSAYRVSKVGLNGLVRVLNRELEGRSIRVNAVDPGWVNSDMGGASAPKNLDEGADTITWLASKEDPEGPRGQFFRERSTVKW